MIEHISPIKGTNRIKIRGQHFDKIKVIGSRYAETIDTDVSPIAGTNAFLSRREEADLLVTSHASDPYPILPSQELPEVFWRTLTGDVTNSSRPAPSSYGEMHTHLLDNDVEVNRLCQLYGTDLKGLRQSIINHEPFDGMKTFEETLHMGRLMMNIGLICWHPSFPRKICVTGKGYVGMVPKFSEIGDEIAIIFGSQVPFVLRSQPDDTKEKSVVKYQLVGECYIHGIMDGEALDSGRVAEDFEII